jgi:hypothetical protein
MWAQSVRSDADHLAEKSLWLTLAVPTLKRRVQVPGDSPAVLRERMVCERRVIWRSWWTDSSSYKRGSAASCPTEMCVSTARTIVHTGHGAHLPRVANEHHVAQDFQAGLYTVFRGLRGILSSACYLSHDNRTYFGGQLFSRTGHGGTMMNPYESRGLVGRGSGQAVVCRSQAVSWTVAAFKLALGPGLPAPSRPQASATRRSFCLIMATWKVHENGDLSRPLGDSEYPLYSASAAGLGDMCVRTDSPLRPALTSCPKGSCTSGSTPRARY